MIHRRIQDSEARTRNAIRGQAMVEAAGTLFFLMLMLFCIGNVFLMAMDKLRSLDTVYHLARSKQVEALTTDFFITRICFPGAGARPSESHALRRAAGPYSEETVFPFFPHGLKHASTPWKSFMRVTRPERDFLSHCWPGARVDVPPSVLTLKKEQLMVRVRLQTDLDTLWDVFDEI